MMRTKFDRPEAEGIFCAGTLSKRMLMEAMKNEPEEIPCAETRQEQQIKETSSEPKNWIYH